MKYLSLYKQKGYYWREIRIYLPKDHYNLLDSLDSNIYHSSSIHGSELYIYLEHMYKEISCEIPLILLYV